jgi:hypothetical protein
MRDFFKGHLARLATAYKECIKVLRDKLPADQTAVLTAQLGVIEGQLAILFYIIGSVIGSHVPSAGSHDEHMAVDAELCALLLSLLPLVDLRLASPVGTFPLLHLLSLPP